MSRTLESNMFSQFLAIDMCIEKGFFMSSLILIYSGIDTLAALNRPKGSANVTRSDFMKWCADYLLRGSNLPCSAIDLYAARCGILHTGTAVSDLSKAGKAAELIYYSGDISVKQKKYQKIIENKYPRKVVMVNIESLAAAYRGSYFLFAEELKQDQVKMRLAHDRAEYYFIDSSHLP